MSDRSNVWMSHMDQVTKVPDDWQIFATSSNELIVAGLINRKSKIEAATQFHPEVSHTEEGGNYF